MKIDPSKSEQHSTQEKKVDKPNNLKQISTEASNNANLFNQTSQQKDFASILQNATTKNDKHLDTQTPNKDFDNNKISEGENESQQELKDKEKVNQEKRNNQYSEDRSDSKEEYNFAQAIINTQQKLDELSILSARSIIHVADLERIISTIRSQTVANGKQVTIELKRSVFQGLKLKLTIGKDKSVIAELISANENVKSQLNAKAEELANILKERGVKLTKLNLSLDSDTNDKDKRGTNKFDLSINPHKPNQVNDLASDNKILLTNSNNDSDTSYQI